MKKMIVLSIAAIMIGGIRITEAQIRVGVTGGMNDSNFKVEEDNQYGANPNDFHNQTMLGVGALIEAPYSDHLYFRTQLMYMQKASFYVSDPNVDFLYRVDYLEIPALIKATLGRSVKPYVMVGGSIGFMVGASADVTMMGMEGTADMRDIAVTTNYSLLLGGGLGFHLGGIIFFIEGIYEHGLRNINKGGSVDIELEDAVIITEDVDALEIKTRGFQMMTGFTFPLSGKE